MSASLTPALHQVWGLGFPSLVPGFGMLPYVINTDAESLVEGQLAPAGQGWKD